MVVLRIWPLKMPVVFFFVITTAFGGTNAKPTWDSLDSGLLTMGTSS